MTDADECKSAVPTELQEKIRIASEFKYLKQFNKQTKKMTDLISFGNNTLGMLSYGWVGSLIGLAGVATAVITYFITRQRAAITFHYSGKRLLGLAGSGLPQGIKVNYEGRDIPRLTRSLVVIWNSGEKTINGSDIATSDPLKIETDSKGTILSATILKVAREANEIKCTPSLKNSNEVELRFSFLDSNDGAVIELLHTSEEIDTRVSGTIKGIPKGINGGGNAKIPNPIKGIAKNISPILIVWVSLIVGLLSIFLAIFFPEKAKTIFLSTPFSELFPVYFAGGLYASFAAGFLYFNRKKYPKSLSIDTDTKID